MFSSMFAIAAFNIYKNTYGISRLDSFEIYNLVNEYRVQNKLKPLKWNPEMCPFAKKRLKEIHSDWSHNGFEKAKLSYPHVYAGENLIKGYPDNKSSVEAWKISPPHNKEMLDPNFTDTCIATDAQFAVQEFASF